MIERRNSGYIISLDGRPPGSKQISEYRSAHRVSKRLSPMEMRWRLDAIEAQMRATDRRLDALNRMTKGGG